MAKSFLLKTVFLVVALAAVSAVMIAVTRQPTDAATAVQDQTFFEQFVIAGGPIFWFVLLPMSLITVYLAADNSLTIRRKRLLPDGIGASIGHPQHTIRPGRQVIRMGVHDKAVWILFCLQVPRAGHRSDDALFNPDHRAHCR